MQGEHALLRNSFLPLDLKNERAPAAPLRFPALGDPITLAPAAGWGFLPQNPKTVGRRPARVCFPSREFGGVSRGLEWTGLRVGWRGWRRVWKRWTGCECPAARASTEPCPGGESQGQAGRQLGERLAAGCVWPLRLPGRCARWRHAGLATSRRSPDAGSPAEGGSLKLAAGLYSGKCPGLPRQSLPSQVVERAGPVGEPGRWGQQPARVSGRCTVARGFSFRVGRSGRAGWKRRRAG